MALAQWPTVLLFTAIPAILMIFGSLVALYKTPGLKVSSALQHFAAGIVIAAVAVELIPIIVKHEIKWVTAIGFAIGVIVMLTTEWLVNKISSLKHSVSNIPTSLIIVIAIDVFIDGILVGVSFLASQRSGIVIASALSLETLFLGISTSIKMSQNKVNKFLGVLIIIGLAALIIIGGILGFTLVSGMSTNVNLGIISCGVAALLYLVAEELLIEAHKVAETKAATISFFIGFLIVLLLA